MPWFLPALAAGATMAMARKLVARYWYGQHAQYAVADPDGIRTVARFTWLAPEPPDDVLLAIAAELARDVEGMLEITSDAIRTSATADAAGIDIVRLARRDATTCTVELTRAWTGVYLGDQTRLLLGRIDSALRTTAACEVTWFGRHDRRFAEPHATPCDAPVLTAPALAR
ncbi:MAG: hypothetical protein H0T89_34235 [Deltaproteobacteria bacterium]|nr:hypothetical protein [Deltaproteobacteria bacterium]MDQ3301016.1 hypothetical protein [Myxococcota bacterium]